MFPKRGLKCSAGRQVLYVAADELGYPERRPMPLSDTQKRTYRKPCGTARDSHSRKIRLSTLYSTRGFPMSLPVAETQDRLRSGLLKLMTRPQRHRLLHGYPLAAAMPFADCEVRQRAISGDADFCLRPDPRSELLVGVLPHPFCNPKVRGCGFCTFPHETFNTIKSGAMVQAVIEEIGNRQGPSSGLANPKVAGLYFGGGTANLTPPASFRNLARKLSETFDVSQAEVTLEGVPAYFVRGQPLLVDIMQEELPARHFRISMGIQTFSETRLEQMGRLAFGRPATFAAAVDIAHQRGMTCSGDLLFNLPGQSLREMRDDVRQAIDIGLDQVCLYHLVIFRGLGTVWSKDDELLSTLPGNEEAAENWLSLREYLLANGFQQTTLTNFERKELAQDSRRYRYELMSFSPDRYQMLGFGPAAISYASTSARHYAFKTINPESSAEYLQAIRGAGPVWNRYFQYDVEDLKLLHLTRSLAGLRIEKPCFRQSFGSHAFQGLSDKLTLLIEEGLLTNGDFAFALTPRGMFFADSIAGFLAANRLRERSSMRFVESHNDNSSGHM